MTAIGSIVRGVAVFVGATTALLFANAGALAAPCTGNGWQPTFVHDLDSPDGPYYVTPGGTFTRLGEGRYVSDACNLIASGGLRDRRGFTTCQDYTRVQCGCSRSISMGNSTCAAFLNSRGGGGGGAGMEQGVDRPGGDYRSFDLPLPDPATCRRQCESEAQCRAWTYVRPGVQGAQARCWLKSTVPAPRSSDCCVSGVRSGGGAGSNEARCDAYARQAIDQQNENARRACGYGGARWQTNYDAHYGWCMGTDERSRRRESDARVDELARCGSGPAARCDAYARQTVEQQNENIRRGCGLAGARWQTNYDAHNGWCLGTSEGSANYEARERTLALQRCGR